MFLVFQQEKGEMQGRDVYIWKRGEKMYYRRRKGGIPLSLFTTLSPPCFFSSPPLPSFLKRAWRKRRETQIPFNSNDTKPFLWNIHWSNMSGFFGEKSTCFVEFHSPTAAESLLPPRREEMLARKSMYPLPPPSPLQKPPPVYTSSSPPFPTLATRNRRNKS